MEPLGIENLPEYVTAWTQGELDPATAAAVQRMLREQPAAMSAVDTGARLTAESRRVMLATGPATPSSLRNRIQAIATEPVDQASVRINFARRMTSLLAIAASIVLSVSIGWWMGVGHARPVGLKPAESSDVIPVSMVSQAGRIHAMCARVAEHLHAAGYPTDVGNLSRDVEADVGTGHPFPDLSSIHYHYVGAGPCGAHLPGTVHLLYKADKTSPGEEPDESQTIHALSLFVQENHGQFPIDAGKLYTASNTSDPFPMFVWRTDKVVYFLIADNAETATAAMAAIAGSPR